MLFTLVWAPRRICCWALVRQQGQCFTSASNAAVLLLLGDDGFVRAASCPLVSDTQEREPAYWNAQARETLQAALKLRPLDHRAKNIILFLGDGNHAPATIYIEILNQSKVLFDILSNTDESTQAIYLTEKQLAT